VAMGVQDRAWWMRLMTRWIVGISTPLVEAEVILMKEGYTVAACFLCACIFLLVLVLFVCFFGSF